MPTSRDYAHQPAHLLLRSFARLRAAGDAEKAEVWKALVIQHLDRVRQSVKSFRFPGGQPIPADRVDDAIQEAYLGLEDMADTFAGASEGEFLAALRRCVWFACMDFGRRELRHDKHRGGSLDEPAFDGGDRGRFDEVLEADARQRAQDADDDREREREAHDLLVWGVGRIKNQNYREVIELTVFEKLDGEAIAERLDITTTNVYQRRKRAIEKLEEVLRDRRP